MVSCSECSTMPTKHCINDCFPRLLNRPGSDTNTLTPSIQGFLVRDCENLNKPAQVRVHKMFNYSCALYSNQEQNCARFFHYLLASVDGS